MTAPTTTTPSDPTDPADAAAAAFVARWKRSAAAERANYQLFLAELCDVLGVSRPDPSRPDDRDNAYVFERSVTFRHADGTTSPGRIDHYRHDTFLPTAKLSSACVTQRAHLASVSAIVPLLIAQLVAVPEFR